MLLKELSVINFKNYSEATLVFDKGINCFVGYNGSGKTNLLDAVYYLSFTKSFFNAIDSQNIKHGEEFFVVQGKYLKEEKEENIYCGVKKGKKKQFKKNKKEYQRLADHIGQFPLVMVSPADSELITEGSDVRRKFLDGIISQFNKNYLNALLKYNKALAQRNSLLKHFAESRTFNQDTLEVWDMQLIENATKVYKARKEFINDFIPLFQASYEEISGGKEKVELEYISKLAEAKMPQLLEKALQKDKRATHTTVGVHKDDLQFHLSGYPIKKFGSQGQQKTYLLAMKIAQFQYIKEQCQLTPILLLDDIFDKLDAARVAALMDLVGTEKFGQIFITDTNQKNITGILKNSKQDYKLFKVKEGEVE